MSFAAPWALLGLLAAAVPILLHLVQRREPPERAFPAVRYLEDATRDHRRRLRFRHWLLLALRTLLVVTLVLAAAGPLARRAMPLGEHAPTALVLVVDNSASSGAVIDGEPVIDALRRAADAVLARATPADRLWLVLADGVARRGTGPELRERLGHAGASGDRLDLAATIRQGRELVSGSGLQGEVVIVSDVQRSAVAPVAGDGVVVVLRPEGAAPPNRSLAVLDPGAQPWGAEGGRIEIAVSASDTAAVPVTLGFAESVSRDLLVTPGVPATERLTATGTGWRLLRATLPPDELRLDDARTVAVRIAPPATVTWDPGDRFLDAALAVLADAGRIRRGAGLRIGALGPGASIVLPPEDPALIGALNRQLAARGSTWQYGDPVEAPSVTDSTALLPERVRISRRVRLVASGAAADTLITADGEPWAARSGNVVLLGSRLDPGWTALPIRAAFVPLLDALATRTVRGEPALPLATVGRALRLPARATAVDDGRGAAAVEGGAPWVAPAPGSYWLLDGADTIGAVSAAIDPRESALARASDDELEAAWPGAIVASLGDGPARSFAAAGRGDLRPLLLVLALGCLVGESLLAGRRRGTG